MIHILQKFSEHFVSKDLKIKYLIIKQCIQYLYISLYKIKLIIKINYFIIKLLK